MSQPARILYVVNDAGFFLSHRLPLALAAQAKGYSVNVATPESAEVNEIKEAGFRFHPVPFTRYGMHPLRELAVMRSLFRLYRSVRPHLIHHVTIKPVLYGGLVARLTRIPAVVNAVTGLGYVFISSGFKSSFLRLAVRWAYRFGLRHANSRVIFQNPDDETLFVKNDLIEAKSAVIIKGSGVDMNRFRPVPESAGIPVVLFASRMLRDKGVYEFVDAAKGLIKAGTNARFVLVGDVDPGNPVSVSAETLEAWQAEGTVEWWGKRDDMPEVLAQAHIVCLPSYREGLPKILIEAAASGRAIVATDVPGCREIVRCRENGLLVPPRDVEALAAALKTLIMDPALRRRLGERGREIAKMEFSVDKIVRETLGVYRELLV